MHGIAVYEYADGDRFEGSYARGLMEGYGVYRFANQDVYEGQFSQGHKSGRGKYTGADGSVFVGEYRLDKRHGPGTFTHPDGRSVQSMWEEDFIVDTEAPVAAKMHGAKQRRGFTNLFDRKK